MDFAVPPALEIAALKDQRSRLADSAAEWEAAARAERLQREAMVAEMQRLAARVDELEQTAAAPRTVGPDA